jgi:hypothetical protein
MQKKNRRKENTPSGRWVGSKEALTLVSRGVECRLSAGVSALSVDRSEYSQPSQWWRAGGERVGEGQKLSHNARQHGQCGRCGERPMQSKQIKTLHTHTLNDKRVVWCAGQAAEAQGRLNSSRKESRPRVHVFRNNIWINELVGRQRLSSDVGRRARRTKRGVRA